MLSNPIILDGVAGSTFLADVRSVQSSRVSTVSSGDGGGNSVGVFPYEGPYALPTDIWEAYIERHRRGRFRLRTCWQLPT